MKRVLFAAALVASFAASADDYVARSGKDSVRLTEGACYAEVLAITPKEIHERLHAATATVGGQEFRACWVESGGFVLIAYADGDRGRLQVSDFKIEHGV